MPSPQDFWITKVPQHCCFKTDPRLRALQLVQLPVRIGFARKFKFRACQLCYKATREAFYPSVISSYGAPLLTTLPLLALYVM